MTSRSGGRGRGFYDGSTKIWANVFLLFSRICIAFNTEFVIRLFVVLPKISVIKSLTMGEGCVKNCPKMRDVIYGRPLKRLLSIRVEIKFR